MAQKKVLFSDKIKNLLKTPSGENAIRQFITNGKTHDLLHYTDIHNEKKTVEVKYVKFHY